MPQEEEEEEEEEEDEVRRLAWQGVGQNLHCGTYQCQR